MKRQSGYICLSCLKPTLENSEYCIDHHVELFINEVFCRRDTNQIKAKKLWPHISKLLDHRARTEFNIAWNHYLLGEFDAEDFGYHTNEFKKELGIK